MEETLNEEKLTKLFNYMYNPKIPIKFTQEEIDLVNKYVKKDDKDSITHFFEKKESHLV